jgi:hypothetical protein
MHKRRPHDFAVAQRKTASAYTKQLKSREIAMNRTTRAYWVARIMAPLVILLAVSGCGDGSSGGGGGVVTAPPVATFALSGTVSHLDATGLTISDGTETVQVAQGASSFGFTKPLANGTAYTVTVTAQPVGANCVVSNPSGSVSSAAVTNVTIACNTLMTQPIALGVLPSISSNTGTRILLPVAQVGTAATTINAILDTGSSGTLLRASEIFPASMVSSTGFVFPAGQTSMTYSGITVTNVVATRTYGEAGNTTVLTGNLGFAQITFGSGTHVTTATAPILFIYDRVRNGTSNLSGSFGNIIGVNPGIAPIIVGGAAPAGQADPCTLRSTTNCGLASPFRYLDYADGIDKGFVLSKVTLTPCDSAKAGSCPTSPNLTIGVTAGSLALFSTFVLPTCGSTTLIGAKAEPVCAQVIPSVTVSSGTDSFTGPMLFDTGTEATGIAVPQSMTFASPPTGSTVRFVTPSGFAYQYVTTGSGVFKTTVVSPSDNASNSGIGFFTQNSLVLDYSKAVIGWRTGS